MNPKIANFAVDLGHLNPATLKDLIDFIRSGESTENVAADAPAPAPAPAPEAEAPTDAAPETPAEAPSDAPAEGQ